MIKTIERITVIFQAYLHGQLGAWEIRTLTHFVVQMINMPKRTTGRVIHNTGKGKEINY